MTTRPALLLTTAVLAGAVLAGCGGAGTASDPADTAATDTGAATSSPPGDEPSDPPSETSGPTATDGSDAPGDTVAVPLYFVGDTPRGPRLYREFRQVDAAAPLVAAATALFGGSSADPDYRSLLPLATVTDVAVSPDAIVVTTAPGSISASSDLPRRQARLAFQSLVYTMQGAAQSQAPVRLQTADGTPVTIYGMDTGEGLGRASELRVLALVNVTTPEEAATVTGSFTAEGLASSFEGTVPWQVVDASGAVVADGFAQAEGFIDGLYPWSSEVDVSALAPGDYTFVARTDDPSDGEGAGPTEDTKTITVS